MSTQDYFFARFSQDDRFEYRAIQRKDFPDLPEGTVLIITSDSDFVDKGEGLPEGAESVFDTVHVDYLIPIPAERFEESENPPNFWDHHKVEELQKELGKYLFEDSFSKLVRVCPVEEFLTTDRQLKGPRLA